MDLSNIKLVVTDMDGTLLNSNHEVSDLFFKLFKRMTAHDVIFVAASGRPYYSITDKLNRIKDNIIVVAENGALAIKNNKTLLSNPIQEHNLQRISDLVMQLPDDAHPIFCSRDKAYVLSKNTDFLALLSEYYANYELIDSIDAIITPVYKVAIFHKENAETYIYPYVKPLEPFFKVKLSATHWVDISEHIANKGNAVQMIQNMYNIKKSDTLAFGDYNNDLEMLENAHFSFAMENAHPIVKATAQYTTKSNDNFGVEHVLNSLVEAKENNA